MLGDGYIYIDTDRNMKIDKLIYECIDAYMNILIYMYINRYLNRQTGRYQVTHIPWPNCSNSRPARILRPPVVNKGSERVRERERRKEKNYKKK